MFFDGLVYLFYELIQLHPFYSACSFDGDVHCDFAPQRVGLCALDAKSLHDFFDLSILFYEFSEGGVLRDKHDREPLVGWVIGERRVLPEGIRKDALQVD